MRSANRIARRLTSPAQGYNRRRWADCRKFFRNPFASLFAGSSREDQLAAYVIREHGAGRTIEDIMDDPYLKNRSTPEQAAAPAREPGRDPGHHRAHRQGGGARRVGTPGGSGGRPRSAGFLPVVGRRGGSLSRSPASPGGSGRRPRSAGAPERIRTSGLSLRRAALYPLSYGRGRVIVAGDPEIDTAARIRHLGRARSRGRRPRRARQRRS